jgi:hypothetical protein
MNHLDQSQLLRGRFRSTIPRFIQIRHRCAGERAFVPPWRCQIGSIVRDSPDSREDILPTACRICANDTRDLSLKTVDAGVLVPPCIAE